MNTRRQFLKFVLVAFAAAAFALSASAQTTAGAIKAARLTGTVQKISKDGTTTALADNQALTESDVVVTGANSSVVLVFANGSSVRLGAGSRLAIDEFKMDPLGGNINVATLQNEPSVSKTRLNLAYGEIVGNVKTLNRASAFNVVTPVGAAGVRGTTFRIVMRFDANGVAQFQLSTLEGVVVYTGTVAAGGTTAPEGVEVSTSQEITVTATVDTTSPTPTVTNVQVSGVGQISEEAVRTIETTITEAIQQAQQATTFTETEQREAAERTDNTPPGTPPGEQPPAQETESSRETTPATIFDPSTRSTSG